MAAGKSVIYETVDQKDYVVKKRFTKPERIKGTEGEVPEQRVSERVRAAQTSRKTILSLCGMPGPFSPFHTE